MNEIFRHLSELISRLPKERQRVAVGMLNEGTLVMDLKRAISDSGMTHYAIGKATCVTPDAIGRFMRGERDMQVTTASKICEVLGYGLAKVEKPSSVKKTASKPEK